MTFSMLLAIHAASTNITHLTAIFGAHAPNVPTLATSSRTRQLLVLEERLDALREQVPVDAGGLVGVELELFTQRLQRGGLGWRLGQPSALELLPKQPPAG